ncbi:MAG: dTDP-4-dehydrorhamnose reductase [Acidimicrobiia bacterium]
MKLVLGGDGQLGTAFRDVFPDARFVDREDADFRVRGSVARLISDMQPSAVINCAAFTAVDAAENDESLAIDINGVAVGEMATACAQQDIPFLTFSTDYVFTGDAIDPYLEDGIPGPVGAYGRSKLIGEWMAAAVYPQTLIVRTSWLISPTHDNFVTAILRRAAVGSLKVVDDQRGKPTVAHDLAVASAQALAHGSVGVVHLANSDETTWFGLAQAVVAEAGMDATIVQPCATVDFPTDAQRPAYSVLGSNRTDTPKMPSWRSSLGSLVQEQVKRLS